MIDYTTELKQFIQDNFTPGTLITHDFMITNEDLLVKLYAVFPVKSIGDYELTEVLTALHYNRAVETTPDNITFKWLFNHK